MLTVRESGYVRKATLRDPEGLFFMIGWPLLFLVIVAATQGRNPLHLQGQPGPLRTYTFIVASVIVITVVAAAFQNLAIFLVRDRELGLLKRLRSAPVPTWVFLGGHAANAMLTSIVLAVLVAALGRVAYGVSVPTGHILAAVITVLVGALACCALAFAVTILVRTTSGAAAVVATAGLTLFFISGNLFSSFADTAPAGLKVVANVFPVRHFYEATLTAFNPNVTGSGFTPAHLGIVALWGAAGLVIAAWKFRWTP